MENTIHLPQSSIIGNSLVIDDKKRQKWLSRNPDLLCKINYVRDAFRKFNSTKLTGTILSSKNIFGKTKKVEGYTGTPLLDHINSATNGFPNVKGKFNGACHEIHLFLGPVGTTENPLKSTDIKRYQDLVVLFNSTMMDEKTGNPYKSFRMMGCPELVINYDFTDITIMQTSMYVYHNDMKAVLEYAYALADAMCFAGYDIYRVKIEAMIDGCTGIPEKDSEMPEGTYTEFHIKVARKNGDSLTPLEPSEIKTLEQTAVTLSDTANTMVALSYNKSTFDSKNINTPIYSKINQRYFNTRYYGMGVERALVEINNFCETIAETTDFKPIVKHNEWVWYDTGSIFDEGWIHERTISKEDWITFFVDREKSIDWSSAPRVIGKDEYAQVYEYDVMKQLKSVKVELANGMVTFWHAKIKTYHLRQDRVGSFHYIYKNDDSYEET